MEEISSKVNVLGSKYIENYASMKKIILELESYFELSRSEGSKEKIKRLNVEPIIKSVVDDFNNIYKLKRGINISY